MSNHTPPPLLTLLARATERERRALVTRLSALGFDDVALAGARLLTHVAGEPRSIQALAAATATTKQFTAREVKKLERGGYVHVEASKSDGRATHVRLAPRGRRLLDESTREKRALEARAKKRLGADDFAKLRELLAKLGADAYARSGR